jgi:protein transport protein SEC61 subunit gamma-like protein
MNLNLNLKEVPAKVLHTLREYKRVVIITKKPDADEVVKISKVVGIGTLIMGVIGFIIQTLFQLIFV